VWKTAGRAEKLRSMRICTRARIIMHMVVVKLTTFTYATEGPITNIAEHTRRSM